jgi:hypothetical protein
MACGSHLFLDEGLDEFCRIVCTTIEDLDGTFPEHVALCIQVKWNPKLSCHSCIPPPPTHNALLLRAQFRRTTSLRLSITRKDRMWMSGRGPWSPVA